MLNSQITARHKQKENKKLNYTPVYDTIYCLWPEVLISL